MGVEPQYNSRPDFPHWAMGIAEAVASRSEDPYVQVGSVVFRPDWTIAGAGYNGLPAGVDLPESWWDDRDKRRPFMIHAEVNALRSCILGDVLTVVSTHIPCSTCMTILGSYRIDTVYYHYRLGEAHSHTTILEVAELNGIMLTQIGGDYA